MRFLLVAATAASLTGLAVARVPDFEEVVIDSHVGEICYAVTYADVDGDKQFDIVALSERGAYWYQAPDWKKRTIIEDQTTRDNVAIAAGYIDSDDHVDFAIGAGWPKAGGSIQWVSRGKSLDDKWSVHMVANEPSLHRMTFADVLGLGREQLVISPLNKARGQGVRLTAFEIPANPATNRWRRRILNSKLNRMHGHAHLAGNGRMRTLTASQEGIHLIAWDGKNFSAEKLADGASGEKPGEMGAGEIVATRLLERPFLAAIEPMHGNSVVAYTKLGEIWRRTVLETTLGRGHALAQTDFEGDRIPELVVGHSKPGTGEFKGPGVFVYKCVNRYGGKWEKHVIDDGGIATEALFVVDLTNDGHPDIVAGGRETHNVKLYVNQQPPKKDEEEADEAE